MGGRASSHAPTEWLSAPVDLIALEALARSLALGRMGLEATSFRGAPLMNTSHPRARLWWAAGAALFASVVIAQDQPKEKSPQKEKLTPVGTVSGKIGKLADDKGSFTLKVSGEVPYLKPSVSLAVGRKPSVSATLRQKNVSQEVDVQLADNVRIRLRDSGKHKDAAADDLRKDQVVQVTLLRNRHGDLFAKTILIVHEPRPPTTSDKSKPGQ